MTEMPETYEASTIETRWREAWRDSDVYRYQGDSDREYIIDTPPPYPTGDLHIGHALNWLYIDFAARYHRLIGDDVMFPQGWDCHGLPTEVKVEENHDIHRTDVPRDEFRQLCIEHTEDQIESMRETMEQLGFSIDWEQEYRTMDPEYWGLTQRSFVEMFEDDRVYRDEHPVNWCPRCQTAIADAEVEPIEREGTLHYLTFPGVDNDGIEIATTRPELLAACVAMAVDPTDERFEDRIGETFEVPLFGQEVELIGDESVDSEFGTGAVMICTFGDKQDVNWWAEYDLELRTAFTEDGHLNELAGEYEGLRIPEAKDAIAADLDGEGYLNEVEPTDQMVGSCWRCDTPIEILSKEQWFVTIDQDAILERGQEVDWIPEHMYDRLEEWTLGMDWDWVISRQRVFATPFPAWFCADCGEPHVAPIEDLPVKPGEAAPSIERCPACGGGDWIPETDVMDTWMDSSITAMVVAGWPDEPFSPTALRPQGHDIIRTWAFYTLLRTEALCEARPWDDILINGMVFGDDGNKMSKSRGNIVAPTEVVEEYGADAFRQSIALGGQPGSDVQFQWKEVKSADRFLTKVWNATRFGRTHFDEETPDITDPALRAADRWLLWRLQEVADDVGAAMDEYRFDAALRQLREFIWSDLADDYVELVKGRLYEGRPGERDAARYTLFIALTASLRMLSPFSPFVTDELWSHLPTKADSIHAASWPDVESPRVDDRDAGELIVDVAEAVRRWKSDQGIALNAELERVELYPEIETSEEYGIDTYDLSNAVNAPVYLRSGTPSIEIVPVEVEVDQRVVGPEFRDQTGAVVQALQDADPARVKREKRRQGEIEVQVNGEVLLVDGEAVTVREEQRAESGEEAALLETEHAQVVVVP